jgi:hypothetical protein
MEKLQKYRQIIREVLTEQAHPFSFSTDVETVMIVDTDNDHYQLSYIG